MASGAPIDPTRIAAQVASGIGFIGAGAIIRDGRSVHGVTTAATLWTAAAIGLGAGAGFVVGTVVATVTVLVVLVAFRLVSRLLARASGTSLDVQVSYQRGHGTLGPVLHALEEHGTVERVRIDDEGEVGRPGRGRVTVELRATDRSEVEALLANLRRHPEIDDVDVV